MALEPDTCNIKHKKQPNTTNTTPNQTTTLTLPPSAPPGADGNERNPAPTSSIESCEEVSQTSLSEHLLDDSDNESLTKTDAPAHTPHALALQWNICGLSTRHAELEMLIKTHNPSVIALQEVQTRQGRAKLENSGYEWEFAFPPGEVTKNGTALGVQQGIPHTFIELDSPLQAVAATLEWPIRATYACIYLCKKDGRSTIRGKLNTLLDQLPLPVILLGDFNAHSDLWGSEQLDERGKAIEEVIGERGLIVLNTGAATRIDWAEGTLSAIDLSLVSDSLARRMKWEVLEDCCGSDHFPIVIRDLDSSHSPQTKRPRWRYDRADWKNLQKPSTHQE